MKKYPACFPENFEKDILPKGAKHEDKDVYRIIKYGKLDRDSFIGTYEEIQRHLIPPKKKMNLEDPGLYSTSCNIEYSEAEYVLNMMMRHYPEPFIAKGCTQKDCGPCQVRLGPEAIPSVPRNTNTAGMIIIPDRKATPVSNSSI